MLKKQFLLSMLKTFVLLNIFLCNHDILFSGVFYEQKVQKNSIYLK